MIQRHICVYGRDKYLYSGGLIDHFKYFEQHVQKFVHYKDRNLTLYLVLLHMNGLLLHLALAQARIHGNAVSEAGDSGRNFTIFSPVCIFCLLPACEWPLLAGSACAALAQSAAQAGSADWSQTCRGGLQ